MTILVQRFQLVVVPAVVQEVELETNKLEVYTIDGLELMKVSKDKTAV